MDFCRARTLSPSSPAKCPDRGIVLGPTLGHLEAVLAKNGGPYWKPGSFWQPSAIAIIKLLDFQGRKSKGPLWPYDLTKGTSLYLFQVSSATNIETSMVHGHMCYLSTNINNGRNKKHTKTVQKAESSRNLVLITTISHEDNNSRLISEPGHSPHVQQEPSRQLQAWPGNPGSPGRNGWLRGFVTRWHVLKLPTFGPLSGHMLLEQTYPGEKKHQETLGLWHRRKTTCSLETCKNELEIHVPTCNVLAIVGIIAGYLSTSVSHILIHFRNVGQNPSSTLIFTPK